MSFSSREVKVGNSSIRLRGIEHGGSQVGGSGVIHVTKGVRIFRQHCSSSSGPSGVSNIIVFIYWFG